MRKGIILVVILICAGLLISAGKSDKQKKKKVQEAKPAPSAVVLPTCPFSRITISPESINDPEIYVGANKKIQFTATAYDAKGKSVPANLTWYFRGLPPKEKLATSDGHKLVASGSNATLFAEGFASGNFKIAAEASDCLDPNGLPLRGTAEVMIYPNPKEPARCGPILVMYGDREITGEKVLGFINFNLKAEVYGPKDLKNYKIQFYLNEKKVEPRRSLIYDKKLKPTTGEEAGYWSYVPVWLKAGDYFASYELLKDKQPVCSSTNTYFSAR